MRSWIAEKRNGFSWKDITLGIVVPFLAVFPWLVILATPIPPFFDINNQNVEPLVKDWVIILVFYLSYLFVRGRFRLLFNAFAFSSFSALILGTIRGLVWGEDCSDKFCLNIFNNYFGLGCIDAQSGCAVEFFTLSFLILFFIIGFFLFKSSQRSLDKDF